MNVKDVLLPELELDVEHVEDGLMVVIHSILYMCMGEMNTIGPVSTAHGTKAWAQWLDITYTKSSALRGVDSNVHKALTSMLMTPIGPNVSRATVTLCLYRTIARRNLIGIYTNHRRYYEVNYLLTHADIIAKFITNNVFDTLIHSHANENFDDMTVDSGTHTEMEDTPCGVVPAFNA
jgi:hypothetical protein